MGLRMLHARCISGSQRPSKKRYSSTRSLGVVNLATPCDGGGSTPVFPLVLELELIYDGHIIRLRI